MVPLDYNRARMYAEGFYAVFIQPKTQDRETVLAYLVSVFEDVYVEGQRRRQREFAEELLAAIGDRTSVPATELRQLVSSLRTARPTE